MARGSIIPEYDISRKGNLNKRLNSQALKDRPNALYSSHWHDFGKEFLNGNRKIDRSLLRVANKALIALKLSIPYGDPEEGHIRNQLKIRKKKHAGYYRDRTGYEVGYGGSDSSKWNAAVRRSSFPNRAAWKNAKRGVYGPVPSWINKAAKSVGG